MKKGKGKARTGKRKLAALLQITGSEAVEPAAAAIKSILTVAGHPPETMQEALRTLAVIGKPPQQVTISHSTFNA